MKSLFKKIVVTTLLVCGSWFSSHAQSNVVPDDIEFAALKAIYDSLGGANWTNKTNWPTAGNWPATATAAQMGTWYGVTVVNGDVTKIIFIANKLIGFVPTHVGNLQRLEMMTFANDKGVVGAIPATIGNLLLLKSVNFAQCNLTRIPASLFNLTSMTSLALHENNISGALPSTMGNATSLVALTINNNKLSGSIPSSIGSLINLTSAKMQYNAFTGAIPSGMGNLVKLTYLSIDNNQLTGSIPASIGNLTKLTVLSLKGNQLSGSIPYEIGNLVELQTLTLFRNQLSGAIPSSIGALHKLTFLDLSSNQITGAIPDTIGGLTLLSQLLLNSNKLSGVIPSSVSGLTNLAIFTLNDNQLSGSIPVGIGNMTGLTNLQLQGNKLTGSIPASFGNMTKLTTLQLYNNQLTGKIPAQLGNLANLQYLYLNDNKLTGEIPPALGSLSKLVQFMVYTNQLEGAIPASFSGLTKLNQFYVYNNKLSGSFPSFITGWTTLGGLQIYNNNFSGPFPEVTGLTGLTGINATGNSFTSIPNSILTLPSLSYVQFEKNQLTYIPDFSTYSGKANLNLYIGGNRLDFSHLEPLVGGGLKTASYLPLNTINDITTISLTDSPLLISARALGNFSTVTWEKRSANGQFALINTDQDSNPRTYTGTSVATDNEGVYRWKMTNTKVTGVTLYSDPITVKTPVRFALDNWAFQYKYDGRKRMTHKKVPGADWVYMVYDDRDRLVMTQDGEQRKNSQWSFTKYDALNRPVMTGIYAHGTPNATQEDMSGQISKINFYETFTNTAANSSWHGYSNNVFPILSLTNAAILSITYYDSYDFLNNDPLFTYKTGEVDEQYNHQNTGMSSPGVIGQVTGTRIRTLGNDAYWMQSVNYYDDKYRVVQVVSDNYRFGIDRVTNRYDFVGKVRSTKTSQTSYKNAWQNKVNVDENQDRIFRTSPVNTWGNCGASSVQQLPAGVDGWMETTVAYNATTNQILAVGFSANDVNQSNATIDYAFFVSGQAGGITQNSGSGTFAIPGGLTIGDRLKISRTGTTIRYYKNGILFYTSLIASNTALMVDFSLNSLGSSVAFTRFSAAASATQSIARTFDYDHAGRLLTTYHSINGATPILLAKNEYNELGQLIDKNLHSTDGTTFKQSTDYRYNIRGWLTSINNADLTPGNNNDDDSNMDRDLFGMELAYEKPVTTLTTATEYNGNISAIMYSNNLGLGTIKSNGYKFDYDPMNRLTESNFRVKKTDWGLPEFVDEDENTLTAQSYSETGFDYDLNGNIKHLTRSGTGNTVMDVLTYDYGASNPAIHSNQLLGVKDNGETTQGFIDGNVVGNDYSYDVNGNMVLDKNKAIMTSAGGAGITYNHLNLPDKVLKSTGDYIRYIYDATGRKLSQQVYNVSNVLKKRSDYLGEYFYENDTLKFINHEEGRVVILDLNREDNKDLLYQNDGSTLSGIEYNAGMGASAELETINGQSYIKITNTCPGACNGGGIALQAVSTQPGETYRIRVKGYSNGPVGAQIMLRGYQGSYLSIDNFLPVGTSSSEGWREVTYTMPAGSSELKVYLMWWMPGYGEVLRVNDIEFFKVKDLNNKEYQYHLKDHLGNVRTTFTTKEEVEETIATLESEYENTERSEFIKYDDTRRVFDVLFDHTKGDRLSVPSNTPGYSIRLNGSANERNGIARSMSVMPGDKIDMQVFGKFIDPNTPHTNQTAWDNLAAFALDVAHAAQTVVIDGVGYTSGTLRVPPYKGVLTDPDESALFPKAHLNWTIFDRNWKFLDGGAKQLKGGAENGTDVAFGEINSSIEIKEPGYVYVWLSNTSATEIDVYFDDFKVTHTKSPVVQQEEYYPLGLTFNNYQRENSIENNKLYNGGAERQIDLDYNVDFTKYRSYDYYLGRWMQIDPLSDLSGQAAQSPYQYAWNNPIRFNDVNGDCPCLAPVLPWLYAAIEAALGAATVGTGAYITYEAIDRSKLKSGTLKEPKFLEPSEFDSNEPNFNKASKGFLVALAVALSADLIQENAKYFKKTEEDVRKMTVSELKEYINSMQGAMSGEELTREQSMGIMNPSMVVSAYRYSILKSTYDLKRGVDEEQQAKQNEEREKGRQAERMVNNFSTLKEGTYTWDGTSWVLK